MFAVLVRFALAAFAICAAIPAYADDFVSDLAACAKAPIKVATFATANAKKAAEFVIDHGECVPYVVSGDPALYGITVGFAGLQSSGDLPTGNQACVDASVGQASRRVAQVLQTVLNKPPMASFMPSEGKAKLVAIAEGETDAALHQVPGIGFVLDRMSCACAVTSSGVNIETLKANIKDVVDSVEGCKGLAGKLFGGVYDAAKALFNAGKDAVNAFTCSFGLGGCSDGPKFFCTGYFKMRDSGKSLEQIVAIFTLGDMTPPAQKCEQKYLEAQKAAYLATVQDKLEKESGIHALSFAMRWIPKCFDAECKGQIAKMADDYTLEAKDPEVVNMIANDDLVIKKMDEKYGARAALAVASSKYRRDKALKADPNAPPADRLDAFKCRPFLGRARQSLCADHEGYQVCRGYVDAGVWNLCTREGSNAFYAVGRPLGVELRRTGCIPDAAERGDRRANYRSGPEARDLLSAQCLNGRARKQCEAFRSGQSPVVCVGPQHQVIWDVSRLPHKISPVFVPPPSGPAPGRLHSTRPSVQPGPPNVETRPVFVAPPPRLPTRIRPRVSTICAFETGPRAGQRQDYAPRPPLPLGTPCTDRRGSTGHVIAP